MRVQKILHKNIEYISEMAASFPIDMYIFNGPKTLATMVNGLDPITQNTCSRYIQKTHLTTRMSVSGIKTSEQRGHETPLSLFSSKIYTGCG
jgi:hypothetical protein